jgi:hypothetical protein
MLPPARPQPLPFLSARSLSPARSLLGLPAGLPPAWPLSTPLSVPQSLHALKSSPHYLPIRCSPSEGGRAGQALEERLRSLAAFLGEYLQRQRTRGSRLPGMLVEAAGAGSRSLDGGSGLWGPGFGPPPAKRPRLEEATKLEEQKCALAPLSPPSRPLPADGCVADSKAGRRHTSA